MDGLYHTSFIGEFLRGDYMPHGHCFLWHPGILWITVLADFFIGLSYFIISAALIVFVRKRTDLRFRGIFFLFGSFICWCGITHFFAIHTIWHGAYGSMAIIKLITALVSAVTAVVLIKSFPDILKIPNLREHQRAIQKAAQKELEKQILESQHEAESIFKFSIELLPTGLLVVNGEKKIVVVNKVLEQLFGYTRDELIGQPVSILLKDSQAKHHELLMEAYLNNPSQNHAMAAGRIVNGRKKNGEEVAIEISLSVYELEGSPHAFASVVDVETSSKQQHRHAEETNRLQRAIDAANDGIWEWNIQTNDVWYSAPLMRMIGYDPDTHKASLQLWLEHIHPDDRPHVEHITQEHFKGNARYDVIYRGLSASGSYEWMHARGNTLFDKNDKPLLMSGTLTNIHEKKLLEQQLAEKTHFLDAVLQKSLCGIYIFDLENHCNIYINEQYTNITGYTLEELHLAQEATLVPLFHPDDMQRIIAHFEEVEHSNDAQGVPVDYRFLHKNGKWIWCYSRDSIYLRNAEGKALQMIGTFFDITDIKDAEKSLAQSNAALERFAYSASHDLQEPLRKISAFSNSLQERLTGKLEDEDASYELERMGNAASRMREMIDSLLQLSRFSRQKPDKELIKLSDLVATVKDDLSELLNESGAKIHLQKDMSCFVDRHSFLQVLRNLVTNSVRYAKPGEVASIEINARIVNNNICQLLIRDNGSGFNPDQTEKIFEPFKRLVGRSIPGSGMGLAICKQIVNAHGGSISASSQPGQGATFCIDLPTTNG